MNKKIYIKIKKKEFEEFREILQTIKSDLEVLEKENKVRFNLEQFLDNLNNDICVAENFVAKLAEKF